MATILITGAAKRIGRAMAIGLAKAGHSIVVHHHDSEAEAKDLVSEISALGVKAAAVSADLSMRDETANLVQSASNAIGEPITVLINNAAIYDKDNFENVTDKSWDKHMEINLHAPFTLSQKFVEQLGGSTGHIINIIDQRVLKLNPQFMSYTLSKSALWTLTKTMAQALGPNVRVNAIGPGPTLPSVHQDGDKFTAEEREILLGEGPGLKEFPQTVNYLLATPSITGQMICLDGGQHLAWLTPDIDPSDSA